MTTWAQVVAMVILIATGALASHYLTQRADDKYWRIALRNAESNAEHDRVKEVERHRSALASLRSELSNADLLNVRLASECAHLRRSLEGAIVFSDRQEIPRQYLLDQSDSFRDHVYTNVVHKMGQRIGQTIATKGRITVEDDSITQQKMVKVDVHLRDIWDMT